MSEITLRQLEYFVAVAETGSLTAAAQRTNMSTTAVGLGLDQLERALGVQLTFRRKSKGVRLTEAGTALVEQAAGILGESRRLVMHARGLSGTMTGTLRIGCAAKLSAWVLPAVVAHFHEEHPGVDVRLVERGSRALMTLLRTADVDAAFMVSGHVPKDLTEVRLFSQRPRVMVSADSPWARRESVRLAELSELPAVLLGMSPTFEFQQGLLRTVGYTGPVRWSSTEVETVRSIVGRGLGFTVLFGAGSSETRDGYRLASLLIEDDVPSNGISLCLARNAAPSAAVRELIEFSRAHVPPRPATTPPSAGHSQPTTPRKGEPHAPSDS